MKRAKLVHWKYVNRMVGVGSDPGRLACGNRPQVGGVSMETTHDMTKVTCGTCRRILGLPRAFARARPDPSAIARLDQPARDAWRELAADAQKALGEYYAIKARGLIIAPEVERVAEMLFTLMTLLRGVLEDAEPHGD